MWRHPVPSTIPGRLCVRRIVVRPVGPHRDDVASRRVDRRDVLGAVQPHNRWLRLLTFALPAWRTPLFMDLNIFHVRHTQSIRLAGKTTHWPDGRNDSNDRCSAGVSTDPMAVAAAGIRCQSLSSGGELPC